MKLPGKKIRPPMRTVGGPGNRDQAAGPSTPTPKAKTGQGADPSASPSLGRGNGDAKTTPAKAKQDHDPKETAAGIASEQARGPGASPAVKTADQEAVPVTMPSPRRRGRRAKKWTKRLTKRNKAKKAKAVTGKSKVVTGSERILGLKKPLAGKAEPGSTPATLSSRGPTTPTKKRVGASETYPCSPLSEQVRDLEVKEEVQRSRMQKLEAENRLLSKDVSRLREELESALTRAASLDAMNLSLHRIRSQTAAKLDEAVRALRGVQAQAEGFRVAAEHEGAARAALAAQQEALDYESRKFRTALAVAFKLLPSLEEQISFRQLVLQTDDFLREKIARGEAKTAPSLAAAAVGASQPQGPNGDNDVHGDGPEEPAREPNLGSDLPAAEPEIVEARPAMALPALQSAAPETTPAGEVPGLKRDRDDTENESDVPPAKRRGNIN